jgi:hypothetical protein
MSKNSGARSLSVKTLPLGVLLCLLVAFREEAREGLWRALGLGGAIAWHAAHEAFLFTRSGLVLLMPVVLFVTVYWGRKLYTQLQAGQVQAVPEVPEQILVPDWMRAAGGMGRSVPAEMLTSTGLAQLPLRASAPERTGWSWFKLLLGALGLSFSGLVFLGACAGVSEWKATWGPVELLSFGVVLLLVGLPAGGSFLIFRSGLRGPFAPARPGRAPPGRAAPRRA